MRKAQLRSYGKVHVKANSRRRYFVPSSFQALETEMGSTIQELKKKYHLYHNQGVHMDVIEPIARKELGNDFQGCVKVNEVQSWLHKLRPNQMIITSTGMNKKEINHAIPIVKGQDGICFGFDTFSKYGQFGYNPQVVNQHPYPEWFKGVFFVNHHPTQPRDAYDCAIRAVAWLKMYQKYGRMLIEMYFDQHFADQSLDIIFTPKMPTFEW